MNSEKVILSIFTKFTMPHSSKEIIFENQFFYYIIQERVEKGGKGFRKRDINKKATSMYGEAVDLS